MTKVITYGTLALYNLLDETFRYDINSADHRS